MHPMTKASQLLDKVASLFKDHQPENASELALSVHAISNVRRAQEAVRDLCKFMGIES